MFNVEAFSITARFRYGNLIAECSDCCRTVFQRDFISAVVIYAVAEYECHANI